MITMEETPLSIRYLTVEEVAAMLRIDPSTIRKLLREGILPGRKVDRSWRIDRQELEAFMKSR